MDDNPQGVKENPVWRRAGVGDPEPDATLNFGPPEDRSENP